MIDGSSRKLGHGGESGVVLTAAAIAEAVGGELIGDPSAAVSGVASLDRATEHELTFLGASRHAPSLARSRAGIVIVSPDLAAVPGQVRSRIVVPDPQAALVALLPRFTPPERVQPGVHPTAVLGKNVRVGRDVTIGPYAVIGDGASLGDAVRIDTHCVVGAGSRVGAGTRLHPHVTLYPGTQLGARVIVHSGSRIGCDGFGYLQRDGAHQKIPHVGGCIVGDDVEIGANSTIDRGSLGDTVIGDGTKIDNLVHIAHNCRVGRRCLLAAQVGLAGSVVVEDGAALGGQVGVSDHHTVGAGSRLAAQAGVFGNIPPNETWSGYPARPHREALRAQAALFRLAPILRRLEELIDRGGNR